MSISSIYIQSVDGKYYKNPINVIDKDTFVCYDEDEPPEIVIRIGKKKPPAIVAKSQCRKLLQKAGFKFTGLKENGFMLRMFPGETKFTSAFACFFTLKEAIPIPTSTDGVSSFFTTDLRMEVFFLDVSLEEVLRIFATPEIGVSPGIVAFMYKMPVYTIPNIRAYRRGLKQKICNQHPWLRSFKPKEELKTFLEIEKLADSIIEKTGRNTLKITRG